jgi:hypothetical protein
MVGIGNVIRVINILLCLTYLPLLHRRIMVVQRTQVMYLLGVYLLLMSILLGSLQNLLVKAPFRFSSILAMCGLVTILSSSFRNQWRQMNEAANDKE